MKDWKIASPELVPAGHTQIHDADGMLVCEFGGAKTDRANAQKIVAQHNARLRLFVWTGVLKDYHGGLAFAVASSFEEAAKLAADGTDHVEKELLANKKKCNVYRGRYGAHLYGSA